MKKSQPDQTRRPDLGIPRKLGHIWIGPQPAPTQWMRTWKELHPEWEYTLYGNDFLKQYEFKTRPQIDEYLKRGQLAGVADLMRLEILYEQGGLLPGADSICLRNTDKLFSGAELFTVFENEFSRGKLVSPIQASAPDNWFIKKLIETLADTDPKLLDDPSISTGNLFTALMIDRYKPEIVIFPSHYFIPIHFTGIVYEGSDPVYAQQMFGTTRNAYTVDGPITKVWKYFLSLPKRAYRIKRLSELRKIKNKKFETKTSAE